MDITGKSYKAKKKNLLLTKNETETGIYWFFRENKALLPACSKEIMKENE